MACGVVQGETLEQQFGEKEVCFRTLDLYTSAVLESTLNPVVQPKAEFRSVMAEMSKVRTPCLRACIYSRALLCPLVPSHLCSIRDKLRWKTSHDRLQRRGNM